MSLLRYIRLLTAILISFLGVTDCRIWILWYHSRRWLELLRFPRQVNHRAVGLYWSRCARWLSWRQFKFSCCVHLGLYLVHNDLPRIPLYELHTKGIRIQPDCHHFFLDRDTRLLPSLLNDDCDEGKTCRQSVQRSLLRFSQSVGYIYTLGALLARCRFLPSLCLLQPAHRARCIWTGPNVHTWNDRVWSQRVQ